MSKLIGLDFEFYVVKILKKVLKNEINYDASALFKYFRMR